jgi:hypothetical protein
MHAEDSLDLCYVKATNAEPGSAASIKTVAWAPASSPDPGVSASLLLSAAAALEEKLGGAPHRW